MEDHRGEVTKAVHELIRDRNIDPDSMDPMDRLILLVADLSRRVDGLASVTNNSPLRFGPIEPVPIVNRKAVSDILEAATEESTESKAHYVVIRGNQSGEVVYLELHDMGGTSWTTDHKHATRFANREDADACRLNEDEFTRIIEYPFQADEIPPVDRSNRCTIGGMDPNTDDHKELRPDGMQKDYVILCDEERAKGFVRPVRHSYKHVGAPGPKFPLVDLTDEQMERTIGCNYVKFEPYPKGHAAVGRYWTQKQLSRISNGCGTVTTMDIRLAESYARDPGFYSGTYCSTCGSHFPVGATGEFIWIETDGSFGPRVGT